MFTENQPHSKALGFGSAGAGRLRSGASGKSLSGAPAGAGQAAGPGSAGSSPGGPIPALQLPFHQTLEFTSPRPVRGAGWILTPTAQTSPAPGHACLCAAEGETPAKASDQMAACRPRHSPPCTPLEGGQGAQVWTWALCRACQHLVTPVFHLSREELRVSMRIQYSNKH